jgi:hypothetical protein
MPCSDRRTDLSPGTGAARQADLANRARSGHRHCIPVTRK